MGKSLLEDAIVENLPTTELNRIVRKITSSYDDFLLDVITKFKKPFVSDVTKSVPETNSFLLPEGTRFYRQAGSRSIFIVEQKPAVRTLMFSYTGNYTLALPYTIFNIVFDSSYHSGEVKPYFRYLGVSFRTSPLSSVNDMLYKAPFSNTGYNDRLASVCLGDCDINSSNFSEMTEKAIARFFNSRFTSTGITDNNLIDNDPKHFGSMSAWARQTILDPLFVLKTKWSPALKVSSLLSAIGKQPPDNGVLSAKTNTYIAEIHDAVWRKLLSRNKNKSDKLSEAFTNKLEKILNKFVKGLSKELKYKDIGNKLRQTMRAAVAEALRGAVK